MIRLLFILAFIIAKCYGQAKEKFIISEIVSKDSFNKYSQKKLRVDSKYLFEDSSYIVYKACLGEWGGSIIFKNKNTGNLYSAVSNCPVAVNKLNSNYIITSTLAHLRGSAKILEIRNPDEMKILKPSQTKKSNGKKFKQYFVHDAEATKGIIKLVDSVGILALATFPLNGQLYHIVTDYKKTFLTKIIDGRFATIDTISNESLWAFDPEVFLASDKHTIVFFRNRKTSGYIDIFNNEIKVVWRK